MSEDGYRKYLEFFDAPPLLVIEWHDSETDAVGWLVINSLKGGAAGGGTRMRKGREGSGESESELQEDFAEFKKECTFLAKTMEIKFRVSGPPIGGAKSVIRFDPDDKDEKQAVLRRWFKAISPYLQLCYGTGGDLNVDEISDVMPLLNDVGIKHPQNGVVVGYFKHEESDARRILDNLKEGVEMPVLLDGLSSHFTVADMITGFGLVQSLEGFYAARNDSLAGKRAIVEGFGAVGGSSAFYLEQAGAKVVGIITETASGSFRWASNKDGLDVRRLLAHRDGKHLPAQDPDCRDEQDVDKFWDTKADIFVPAARSHLTTRETLKRLSHAEVKLIACGANNPFERGLETQQQADRDFSVIPDFIANCGTARLFAYLMETNRTTLNYSAMCEDVAHTVRTAMNELLDGYDDDTGLLNRAYSIFIP